MMLLHYIDRFAGIGSSARASQRRFGTDFVTSAAPSVSVESIEIRDLRTALQWSSGRTGDNLRYEDLRANRPYFI